MEPSSQETSSDLTHKSSYQVKARLPLIEFPKFSGKLIDWVSFFDLFQSLVHDRDNMSDAEKHYYLRASLEGEALSIIRQLPMDEANYEVALNLLKARYQNQRLLLDTYLDRIINLPILQGHHSLKSDFFDPHRESLQALEALKVPIEEWSYLILYIILQKLPIRIRSLFEERYGKSKDDLPTLDQLMDLLDEQCRLHQSVSEPVWVKTPRQSPPLRNKPSTSAGPSSALRASGSHVTRGLSQSAQLQNTGSSRHAYEVTSSSCSFCQKSDHTLYRCGSFKAMTSRERKSWARKSGHCFKCLRKHFATECQLENWCYHCKSPDHNSLICLERESRSKGTSSKVKVINPNPTSSSEGPNRTEQGSRSSSPRLVHSIHEPTQPIHNIHYQQSKPKVGERALQAQRQFNELRFGSNVTEE